MPFYGKENAIVVDGAELSRVRCAVRMKMSDLAVKLGCGKSSVSKWEMGRLVPSEERIRKMVEIFGTNSFVRVNPGYGKKRRYGR